LVEVALSIGIVSFALLALLGVIPVGLSSLRESMDSTVESHIIRQIGAEALLTPYTQLETQLSGAIFYYDDEGTFLAKSPTGRPDRTRYWASASLATPSFPGSDAAPNLMDSLKTVHITLRTGPTTNAVTTKHYSIQVPNSGN